MPRTRVLLIGCIIWVIASLACSSATAIPTPTPTLAPTATREPPTAAPPAKPTPTNTRPATRSAPTPRPSPTTSSLPAGVLFSDDFSSQQASEDMGWNFDSGDNVDYTWSANRQTISIKKKQWLGLNWPDGSFKDFGAETEAQSVGNDYAEYGLVFREGGTQDKRSYYIFGVTTQGKYYVQKKVDGNWADTDPVPATASQYVKQGKTKNTLAVLAQGSKISLYVNGFLVKSITDNSISSGSVGLFAATGDNDSAEVAFSNLTVLTADKAVADWGTNPASGSTQPQVTPASGGPSTGTGNGIITVRNTFAGACQITMWGPQNLSIRAEGNSSASKSAPPGSYGVHAAVDVGEVDLSYQIRLRPGGYCTVYCNASSKSVSAGCN